MAIYHFSAKVISRASGSSALAAAAYRSASRLHDERIDRHHDFTNKAGVVHSEVMLPDGAPEHLSDRERLWNEVEAAELRKDAQLAREIEFAIPRELDQAEGIRLARDFVKVEFVDRGMIADLNVHWDIGADGEAKPHAHVMLTMRDVDADGFGPKNRDWNCTDLLERWRERWSEHANRRLAELDIDARIDHRSLQAQGIELEPQHKIGPAASRMATQELSSERLEEHHAIARSNGAKLLANPALAIDAITHGQATFTTRDLAMFVHRHSDGKEQFDRVMAAVKASPEFVALGTDGRGEPRFTSRAMIETERRLEHATPSLEARRHHLVAEAHRERALRHAAANGLSLSPEQRSAFDHVTKASGLSVVIGYAGTGKSAMLGVAREAWADAGYSVRGIALSGIAAENLESGSGIASRTIASLEHQWAEGRDHLTDRDVLVIDEAGMIGTRQMERVLSEAEKRGAKVVLVGDPEQLQAIEAGAAFRATAERHGSVEITQIRRQREDWQRDATRQLATGRTAEALAAYHERDRVHVSETRDHARAELIDSWGRDRAAAPGASRIILTHTNDEVRELNLAARERMWIGGELGGDVLVTTECGGREFATGDRVMFLRNDRGLEVKNGTLGTVDEASRSRMAVVLDDGRSVAFDIKDYAAIDHGYAATVHKSQGVTVDRVYVLATPGMDRHAAYVAMSRHRDRVDLHYGHDDFAGRKRLIRSLSRERGKDMAADYPVQSNAELPQQAAARQKEPARSDHGLAKLSREELVVIRDRAIARHARAVQAIFAMHERGIDPTLDEARDLQAAAQKLDGLRPHAALDAETAYKRDPSLAAEAARGDTERARLEIINEMKVRTDPALRANRFVEDWTRLSNIAERSYVTGDDGHRRAAQNGMRAMAMSLERDPQLESILANRKSQLGIGMETGRKLGAELAFSQGIDLVRGRGLSR